MSKKNKIILIMVIVVIVAGAGFYFLLLPQFNVNKTVTTAYDPLFGWKYPTVKLPTVGAGDVAYSDIRDPGGIPSGLPVRLKIPVIGVDSAIEDALITPDGRMDVPQGSVDVAWFALGPHPGQEGSAVIGGHFGIRNGVPFVFYNLDKLKVGDKIYIEDDKGGTLAFQVRRIELFGRNDDATTVFTSNDGKAHLNLITCEGIWNQINGTYPSRRVVFTDSIAGEGPVTVNPLFPSTAIPSSTPTPATVPATSPTPSPAPVNTTPTTTTTNTPTSSTITTNTSAGTTTSTTDTSQTVMNTLKSLFATPLDGLITSILLLAIIFILFKIIRP